MEHNETNNWLHVASEAQAQQQELQAEIHSLKQNSRLQMQEFKTVSSYNKYLENKVRDLETQNAQLQIKFTNSIVMLKNAKRLLRKRKADLAQYSTAWQALHEEKTKLENTLQEEKFAHEQARDQLSETVDRLAQRSFTKYNTTDREFAFKLLYAPENLQTTSATHALQKDVALIEQMLYLEELDRAEQESSANSE